jgi:FAD/FMN-containing dehydrogenase
MQSIPMFQGEVISQGDEEYEEARQVFNGMIQRRPKLIARCRDAADVAAAVKWGKQSGLPVSVRGGGHSAAGMSVCDDGLVIDLSEMKQIEVDPAAKTVRVEPGCTLLDLDQATQTHGLIVPSGIVSCTGVAGLTLGGGTGYLSRKYGLTIDNLLGAELVLADGSSVTADADTNADLFWAIRGGGGNFGIVTAFTFRAYPVENVIGGPTLWPIEQMAEVMRFYDEVMANASEDLNGAFANMIVPPGPPFPEELHFKKVCAVVWCYTGDPENAEEVFAPIRDFGPPLLYGVQPMPFAALQQAFDALYPPGEQWYWRAAFVNELSDEAIAQHVKLGPTMPTLKSTMHLYPINGAVHRVSPDETAFSYRDAKYSMVILGIDADPANAETIRSWAVNYSDALRPYSASGGYVNAMMDEGVDRVRAAYRDNYERLAQIKAKYDPDNFFRFNQNIVPARERQASA